MRIISGKYGRRHFQVPKNFDLRPTTEIAKEALFSALESEIDLNGVRVLDLFSGTGSIGLEFLSRGASQVTWVDLQPRHCAFVRQVIKELQPDASTSVLKANVRSFLEKSESVRQTFDIIFADPPYALEWLSELPLMILNSALVAPSATIIVEHPSQYDFSDIPQFQKHKRYSAVNYSFFRI